MYELANPCEYNEADPTEEKRPNLCPKVKAND